MLDSSEGCKAKSKSGRRAWLRAASTAAAAGAGLSLPWWAQAQTTTAGTARSTELPLRVLLIGNGTYSHNAVLRNPERDTSLLASAFQARGAQVQALANLSASQLDSAVRSFLQQRSNRPEALWLGYSGHAVQINGRNYLQGVDSDFSTAQRVRERGVDLDLLLGLIDRARPPAAVLSIDACRNNPFEPERTRGLSIGLAAQEPRGLCVSFSTAPYTKALDGEDGQNSPYALALAKALSGQQAKSLDLVLRETADSVFRATRQRQIPEYRSALRSEWWFGPRGVQLRDAQGASIGNSGGASREVSYRPDEPAAQNAYKNAYSQASVSQWIQLDQQLQMAQRRLGAPQAQELLRQTTGGRGREEDRLLAAMVLQDGHQSIAAAPVKARQLLLPLANQGHVLAQTLLGESFYSQRDYAQAYKWLDLAARSGLPRATMDRGQLIAEGRTSSDPQAGAFELLRGMAEQSKQMMPPTQASPEALEQAEKLRQLFQPSRRP